ncbi:MAG: hypothetical protein JW818_01800 [Pirellulales bacterium]|nr:hypothetical protein [Pirellulales bacterium]
MNNVPLILTASAVLLGSGGLLAWHYFSWQRTKQRDLAPEETQFLWRQCRRRSQCSGMLGILALILIAYCFLNEPLVRIVLLMAMVLLLAWVVLLAFADMMVARYHYGQLEHRCLLEQTKLEIEARRLCGNGRAKAEPTEPEPPEPD